MSRLCGAGGECRGQVTRVTGEEEGGGTPIGDGLDP